MDLFAQSRSYDSLRRPSVAQNRLFPKRLVLDTIAVSEGESVATLDGGCKVTVLTVARDTAIIKVALDNFTPTVFPNISSRDNIMTEGKAGLYGIAILNIRGKLVDLVITLRKLKR